MRLALALVMLVAVQAVAVASGERLKLAEGGKALVPVVLSGQVTGREIAKIERQCTV